MILKVRKQNSNIKASAAAQGVRNVDKLPTEKGPSFRTGDHVYTGKDVKKYGEVIDFDPVTGMVHIRFSGGRKDKYHHTKVEFDFMPSKKSKK